MPNIYSGVFGRLAVVLAGFAASFALHAQTATPAGQIFSQDMREEIVRISVTVKDMYNRQETRPVPITIYRPAGDGPFPLFVLNHGRPTTDRRTAQGRFRPDHAARYLVGKGFVVLVPMRVGYWETLGDFDPEDSGPCNNKRIEPTSIAASEQVLATVEYARTLPYVDTSRWLVGGTSMGGLTSVGTVGRNPKGLLAGINFAGGSGGDPVKNPGVRAVPTRSRAIGVASPSTRPCRCSGCIGRTTSTGAQRFRRSGTKRGSMAAAKRSSYRFRRRAKTATSA